MTTPMNTRLKNRPVNYRYDYDVGTLVKSPCKGCDTRPYFPECIDRCTLLDQIHTILSDTISCTRRR